MIDKELVTKPVAEYLASATDEVLAERYLERIIGRMIDINYHVLTESGQPPPRGCATASPMSTRRSTPRACMKRCSPPCGTSPNT